MKLSGCNLPGIMVVVFVMLSINSTSAVTKFNVLNFRAKPNGRTDSTDGFLKAWNAACGSADSSFIYVPKGRYLVGSLEFKGKCRSPEIIIRIDGTIVAPLDYAVLGKSRNWFSFEGVTGVSIIGAGAFGIRWPNSEKSTKRTPHILAVFRAKNVLTLPSQYVLKRWTRNAKIGDVQDEHASELPNNSHESLTDRFLGNNINSLLSPFVVSMIETYVIPYHLVKQDEKEKKIRQLSTELESVNRRCEVYRANLLAVLRDMEEQKLMLSVKVQNARLNMRE
ncbi:hypothetical protein HRI_001716100 [Hibiscus trionum]|uniref:Polygalacturonase n=1 Tax=Hibiscus trionum TaxID=183268 RepID=A0A9W7HPH0_HIBTR|nr:hypothetical protein HRI_001716100 [Hibiscus trionum]